MGSNGLNQALQNTVQIEPKSDQLGAGFHIFTMLSRAGAIIPPWWSDARDAGLRKFVRDSDALSGAMFAIQTKLTTIPLRIVPRDMSIKSHQAIAEFYQELIMSGANFGGGWIQFYSQWLEDYYGQDNGAFAEIIGDGPKDEEIQGPVISIAHLDSARCTRTGNAIYPVLYRDRNGKIYKLHYTRVMFESQQPSPASEMNKVGYCAVSRCINAAQNLIDLAIYKQEKMGSRPMRSLLVTKGGIDPEDVVSAMTVANGAMNLQGLSRFAKSVVIGNRSIPDADLKLIDLASVYDGFDEETATVLGMALIALGFGTDARELFPVNVTGSTKADAIISHMKERGKAPGHTLQLTEQLLNKYVLPSILRASFDYQDDAEDRQVADIEAVRAQSRQRDIQTGVIDVRTSREKMLKNGEITHEQFVQLELNDGRLEDGVSVEVLFHNKKDSEFVSMLGGSESDEDKRIAIMEIISTSRDVARIEKARQALAAVDDKIKRDQQKLIDEQMAEVRQQQVQNVAPMDMQNAKPNNSTGKKPDTSYQTEKFGRKLGQNPTAPPPKEATNYV
jgi:hypothetical protein